MRVTRARERAPNGEAEDVILNAIRHRLDNYKEHRNQKIAKAGENYAGYRDRPDELARFSAGAQHTAAETGR